MRLHDGLAAVLFFASSVLAQADTLFNISGSLQSGNTFSGTITLNPNGGPLGSEGFDAINVQTTSGLLVNRVFGEGPAPGGKNVTSAVGPENAIFTLILGVDELLQDYQGSAICSTQAYCGVEDAYFPSLFVSNGITDDVTDGAITLPGAGGVTPEPSTIALFSTGLFGVAGVVKRRYA